MIEFTPQLQQDWIDLLSEDELDSLQRDQLFRHLDQTPDGWKVCSLALLENRALKVALRNYSEMPEDKLNIAYATRKSSVPESQRGDRRQWTLLFIVASLLLACGFFAGRIGNSKSPARVGNSQSDKADIHQDKLVENYPTTVTQFDWSAFGIPDGKIIAFVGLKENDRSKIYPIIESPELADQLLELKSPKLPERAESDLAKRGWKVSGQKQLVAVEQKNGTRKTYPVGMLNYQFVGRETF